jgi:hypothetical protein
VILVVVVVVVVIVVGHFNPKFIYISAWQQRASRLQTSAAKAMHEEHTCTITMLGLTRHCPAGFAWNNGK